MASKIPSSQDQSKRSSDSSITASQEVLNTTVLEERNEQEETQKAFLSAVLKLCGYLIRQPAANNEMIKNAIDFRRTLTEWLVANDNEMSRIETDASKFAKAVDAYLLDKRNFIHSMKPTKHNVELIQPSLLYLLLGIEVLQARVLKVVCHFLTQHSISSKAEDVSIVTKILDHLKWLPPIVDVHDYLNSLFTIVEGASTPCQSTMIRFLPEIMPPDVHSHVATRLLDLFSDDESTLNIALIYCFSSLDIPDNSFKATIKTRAIDQMATAPLQDIPAYLSFLFRSETTQEIAEVVSAIREKLTLTPVHRTPKTDEQQVDILEKLGFCTTVNPGIVQIWTKQIKYDLQNDQFEDIKKIDLLMLFIFLEAEEQKAVTTLKMLFALAQKQHVLKLFDELMRDNLVMVYQLFTPISKFLDTVMRIQGRDLDKSLDTVAEFSVKLFLGLTAIEAQTLMGKMTSILVNYPPSRDTVLQIFSRLADIAPKKLLNFAPYLMSVLEYVMHFPPGQIRTLMNVLAILSQSPGRNPEETNHFNPEFTILLRKQLTHTNIKIRSFGVYGTMAAIRQMATQATQTQPPSVPDEMRIAELLKLAWGYVERDDDSCNIFLDELSICVRKLPQDICATYRDILKQKFRSLWTTLDNTISSLSERKQLNLVPSFDANQELTQDNILLNFENHPMSMSPVVIPAHIRVLALLEEKVEGDLVGIDAILGCPILIPSLEDYYEKESISDMNYNQRSLLGQYLTLAINFLRETVCAFAGDKDGELRVKVCLRLDNIVQLQKLMVKHYDSFPVLPFAYVAEQAAHSTKDGGAGPSVLQPFQANKVGPKKPTNKSKATKGKAAPKKHTEKKAKTEVDINAEPEEEDETPKTVQTVSKVVVNLDEAIQPKRILPFLRRFDASVFSLLRFPLNSPGNQSQGEMLSPEVLTLLLAELRRQVLDKKCRQDILKMNNEILNHLVFQMHQIRTILIANKEYQIQFECCLRLLIHILAAYLEAVEKIDKDDKENYIQIIVNTLNNHVVAQETTRTQEDVMSKVACYLGEYKSVINDPTTALDHLKLLKSLHDLSNGNSEMKTAIDRATREYLKRDWKLSSANVEGFLKIWIGTADQPIQIINHLADKLLRGAEEDAIFNNTVYKSCSSANFHTWYNTMLHRLSQHVYKNLRKKNGDFEESIRNWSKAISIFNRLVSIAQKETTSKSLKNAILIALLKHCRLFLEAFISGGADLLLQFMKNDKDEAQRFCKTLQVPCRVIQHICEHSKIHTDLQLLKSVPLVKRVLETLVFRVRELLGSVGAASAFWMGALKHRDLQGSAISSQIYEGNSEYNSSDEEEDSCNDDDLEAEAVAVRVDVDEEILCESDDNYSAI